MGIVTDPDERIIVPGRPGVLLLNAGMLHRIGPNRLYVRIARRLAVRGFTVMRLDFSGIGDSAARRDALTREEASVREAQEAMEFLAASRGTVGFVPMGLCWGADNAFRLAREDPRVAGAVMIDGYAYRTPRYHAVRFRKRALNLQKWRNLLSGHSASGRTLRRMLRLPGEEPLQIPGGISHIRSFPPKEKVGKELYSMLDRGLHLLLLYSEFGMEEYYNYPSQLYDTFPTLRSYRRLRVDFFRATDHTFTLRQDQHALIELIEHWMEAAFGGLPAEVPPSSDQASAFRVERPPRFSRSAT